MQISKREWPIFSLCGIKKRIDTQPDYQRPPSSFPPALRGVKFPAAAPVADYSIAADKLLGGPTFDELGEDAPWQLRGASETGAQDESGTRRREKGLA